jgi:hypothetical protein
MSDEQLPAIAPPCRDNKDAVPPQSADDRPSGGGDASSPRESKKIDQISLLITAAAAVMGVVVGYIVGLQADETARIIGINNLLSQVEHVMDSHQGTRACARYIVKANLVHALLKSTPVKQMAQGRLPEDDTGNKDECLAGIYRVVSFDSAHAIPAATEWDYAREQTMSFLNILDLAASYTSIKSPDEVSGQLDKLAKSERTLVEMLQGITDEDTIQLMREWKEVENQENKDKGKKIETIKEIWKVCQVVNCEEEKKPDQSAN